MPADPSIYASDRMAESYARHRPLVHPAVCAWLRQQLKAGASFGNALDAGCGAGASTLALAAHAEAVTGLDPFPAMIQRAKAVAPGARFVQGRLEELPFTDASFELVTTAGALNYTDPRVALAELSRVLQPGGWLAAYDFSAGRRLTAESQLPHLHQEFRSRYPSPPGYALNLAALPLGATELSMIRHASFQVSVPMTLTQYVDYMLSETGVELALSQGAAAAGIRVECQELFGHVFAGAGSQVVFDVEVAVMHRTTPTQARVAID